MHKKYLHRKLRIGFSRNSEELWIGKFSWMFFRCARGLTRRGKRSELLKRRVSKRKYELHTNSNPPFWFHRDSDSNREQPLCQNSLFKKGRGTTRRFESPLLFLLDRFATHSADSPSHAGRLYSEAALSDTRTTGNSRGATETDSERERTWRDSGRRTGTKQRRLQQPDSAGSSGSFYCSSTVSEEFPIGSLAIICVCCYFLDFRFCSCTYISFSSLSEYTNKLEFT